MSMHNPPHPGEFIREIYLEPLGISYRTVSEKLKVAPQHSIGSLMAKANISSEMALRLSKILGRSAESWLIMQSNYNLWLAKQKINIDDVEKLVIV